MALTQTQVSELYVAIFNRASEGSGNRFWQQSGLSAVEAANEMLATQDAQNYFGSSLDTNQAFIEHIYANTLNKTLQDDPDGIAYWVDLLDNGASRGEVVAGLIEAVASYKDSTDPVTKAAYEQFTNRVSVSDFMAKEVDATPPSYATVTSFGADIVVTDDKQTVIDAMQKVAQIKSATEIHAEINNTFTLQKVVNETINYKTDSVTTAHWGGPDGQQITMDQFYEMVRDITGQDLFELQGQNINIAADAVLTNVTIVPGAPLADGTQPAITYTTATGEQFTSELALGQDYISLLDSLIYYTDADGNKVSRFSSDTQDVTTSTSSFSLAPIVLTTTVNNGSTFETGFTGDENDLIVAGQTELLNGAYIDGGAGTNTLEVSMKGVYAQPIELLNIQNVHVENLPNVYTDYYDLTNDFHADGYDIPDYMDLTTALANQQVTNVALGVANTAQIAAAGAATAAQNALDTALSSLESNNNGTAADTLDTAGAETLAALRADVTNAQTALDAANADLAAAQEAANTNNTIVLQAQQLVNANSILDLSNAGDMQNLIVTEGSQTGTNQQIGSLTIVGVRGNATTTLEGSFTEPAVNIYYSEGLQDGVNLTLDLGNVNGTVFNVFQDSETININSIGGGNVLTAANFGNATLTNMNISGSAVLDVANSIAADFAAGHPATIDAHTNTAGVDLNLSGFNDDIVFTGTAEANDNFTANTLTTGSGSSSITTTPKSVVVNDGNGDNDISVTALEDVTVTAGDGENQISATSTGSANLDNEDVVTVTVGNGSNDITANSTDAFIINAGDGDNRIVATTNDAGTSVTDIDMSTIAVGGGQNEIDATATDLAITTGDGNNEVQLTALKATVDTGAGDDVISATAASGAGSIVTVDAKEGDNTVTVSGYDDVNITAGSGDDTVNIIGGNVDLGSSDGPSTQLAGENGDETMINVDLGAGQNTLTLGDDAEIVNQAITAMPGSTITGSNITLDIQSFADLSRADISGVTAVEMGNGDGLTLSVSQFEAMGGSTAFSVIGESFGAASNITLVVDQDTNLNDLALSDLPRSIDLKFEVTDNVTLTMTAQQLHERVAADGVSAFVDNNGDLAVGTVVITDAGEGFDAFTPGLHGSVVPDTTLNVYLDRDINGYERPVDGATYTRLEVNTDQDLTNGELHAFATPETFLRITGNSDLTMVPVTGGLDEWGTMTTPVDAIKLGSGTAHFKVDFSSVAGSVNGLVFDNFENADAIYGNGDANSNVRVDVNLGGDVASAEQGLVSMGVNTFVVDSTYEADTDGVVNFYTCATTQNLHTLGIQGFLNDTVNFLNTERGVDLLIETAYLKSQGYGASAVEIGFARPGADAVVNVVATDAVPAGETQNLAGIETANAQSVTVNVTGGDTVITTISDGDSATDLVSATLTADANLTVTDAFEAAVDSIDASGVTGDFTAATATDGTDAFTFVGSAGTTDLTIDTAVTFADGSSFTAAGTLNLSVDDGTDSGITVDLTSADVSDVDSVFVGDGDTVTMTIAQSHQIGEANITTDAAASGTLKLVGLGEEAFSLANYDQNLVSSGISLTIVDPDGDGVVTLNSATDLTGVTALTVPKGVTLNLTAAQFQELTDAGTITGAASTADYTVNITDLAQVDLDTALDTSDINADNITIATVEDITFVDATDLAGVDSISMADDTTLSAESIEKLGGIDVSGTNGVIKILDKTLGSTTTIDASGFDVSQIMLNNTLVSSNSGSVNVDALLAGLPFAVEKVIYNDEGLVIEGDQTVTVEAQTTVAGTLEYNKLALDTEVQNFTLNMMGGAELGDVDLSSAIKTNQGDPLLNTHLKTVVINSTGTEANLMSDKTANIMGNITAAGTPVTPGTAGDSDSNGYLDNSEENNLLDVTVNATQDLQIAGITFSAVNGDDAWTINDQNAATATLTVNGDSNVTLGTLDTTDDDVDALNVVNNGTGTLTATVDAAHIDDDAANNVDALSFTGTGATVLNTVGDVDLSDDTLDAVTAINVSDTSSSLTLSYAQLAAIGAGNVNVVDGSDADTTIGDSTLNINGYAGEAFDATTLDPHFATVNMVLADADVDLTANAVDLTGVDSIKVAEGHTLTMTAAQFQALEGNGAITAYDTDGNTTNDSINVNIVDLTQSDVDRDLDADGFADADDGFSLEDVNVGTDGSITVSLGEPSVTLGTMVDGVLVADSESVLNGAQFALADTQTLGLVSYDQANGLDVAGGTDTTIVYRFSDLETINWPTHHQIDASGYDVTTLQALAASFTATASTTANNVEFSIDNLPNDTTLDLYADSTELGFLDVTNRVVVIDEGITTPTSLVFNAYEAGREVRTIDLTLSGDATLSEDTDGNSVSVPTRTDKDGNLITQLFDSLTIHSVGSATNTIKGDITTDVPFISSTSTDENNLLNVAIDAQVALDMSGGDIVFNSIDVTDDDAVASLTVGGIADVSIHSINATDTDIGTVNVTNNSTGTLTVTDNGVSAFDLGDHVENVVLSGAGDIVLGTVAGLGVEGAGLSTLNASGLSGDLTLTEVTNVDSADFTFTSGTGVTTMTLTDDGLDSTNGTPNNLTDDTAGWTFDFTQAALGSELHIDSMGTLADGSVLNIMGTANTTIYVDSTLDLSHLDLSIDPATTIVLADGANLTLTAAQANGLHIVEGADTGLPEYTGHLDITDLGTDVVDFSGIDTVPTTVTLDATNDVTVDGASILGGSNVAIQLTELADTSASLLGQTIRFHTVDQAQRTIDVVDSSGEGDSSTNVVWLLDAAPATPIDTANYDSTLGRLWLPEALVSGHNVENLYTTLPSSILRADFGTLHDLNVLLSSNAIDRTMEVTSFNTLDNMTFEDIGISPEEHLHSLTLDLGGETTVGNISIADILNPGYDPASVSFDSITIDSFRSVRTGDLYASEGYVNDNDGSNELKSQSDLDFAQSGDQTDPTLTGNENVAPVNMNTVGNIGVGTDNGLDLLTVNLDTKTVTVMDNSSAGHGAALTVGTITYETDTAGSTATLNVTGDNNITITAVDTSDTDITGLTLDATDFTATLDPIMHMDDTETLTIENRHETEDDITLSEVEGNELSYVDASNYNAELTMTLSQIDSTNDDRNDDGDTTDPGDAAFNYTAGAGVETITVAAMDGNVPTLNAESTWNFDFTHALAGSTLTLSDTASLAANSNLILTVVPLVIDGDVDLSAVNVSFNTSSIEVAAGNTLTLTPEQADGLTVTGAGDVVISTLDDTMLQDATLGGTIDLSHIMTTAGDTGTVTIAMDSTGDMNLGASDLGVATVNITGTGTIDASSATIAPVDRNATPTGLDVSDDTEPSFTVGTGSTLNIAATQAGQATGTAATSWNLNATGAGTVTVENLSGNADADLSGLATTSVTAVTNTVTFTGNLGTAVTTVNQGQHMTTSYTIATGHTINDDATTPGTTDTGTLDVTLEATANDETAADLSTITSNMTAGQITADFNENMTFTGNLAGHNSTIENGVTVTTDASTVDALSVGGTGSLVLTGLSDPANLGVDLSHVAPTTATAAFDADGTFTGDLGTVTVTIADGKTMTASATVLVDADVNKSTVAGAPDDGAVVVTVSSADNNYDSDNADGDSNTATGTFEEVDLDLDNIIGGATGTHADITSITVTNDITFRGTLNSNQATLVADGATLSTTSAIANASGQDINKVAGGTTGAVAIDATVDADFTLAGSADFTVNNLVSDLTANAVTGNLNVNVADDSAINVDLGDGTNIIDATALSAGNTLSVEDFVNNQAGATVTTENGNIDASAIAANGDTATGGLTLNGGDGNNTITGSDNDDIINGGIDDDSLTGGLGNDTFIYDASLDINHGETINGGAGVDTIEVNTANAIDFSTSTLTSMNILDLQTGGVDADVTFAAADFNGFGTRDVDAADSITVNTLSGLTVDATAATDTFVFAAGDTSVTLNSFAVGTDNLGLDSTFTTATTAAGNPAASEDESNAADANGATYDLAAALLSQTTVLDLVTLDSTVLSNIANADLSAATDGSQLLLALSTNNGAAATDINVDGNGDAFYLLVSDGTDSYLYEASDDVTVDGHLTANEISLVGVLSSTDTDAFNGATNADMF